MPETGKSVRRFPGVQEVDVEWGDHPRSGEDSPSVRGIFPNSMRAGSEGFNAGLACSNPLCQAGGFEVDFLLESMISEQAKEKSGVLVCIGWEKARDSGKKGNPCTRAISYRLRIRYRRRAGQATPKETNGHSS